MTKDKLFERTPLRPTLRERMRRFLCWHRWSYGCDWSDNKIVVVGVCSKCGVVKPRWSNAEVK